VCDDSFPCNPSFSEGGGKLVELEGSEVSVNVRSFTGTTVLLKVAKKAGMEGVELLSDGEAPVEEGADDGDAVAGGLWDTLSK
jgi:hypothetical protein